MPAPRHPLQDNILLVSQCLSLPLQHPRMVSKGWFSAGWKECSLDSLIIEEITRPAWSQKHNFWAQNSGWTALQTGELLPLEDKRWRSCADRQLWPERLLPVQLWL